MVTNHDSFTEPMRDHLNTAVMGLGLARLLQKARRFDEARETLHALEEGIAKTKRSKKDGRRSPARASAPRGGAAKPYELSLPRSPLASEILSASEFVSSGGGI